MLKSRFNFNWEIRENTADENIIHEVFTDESYNLKWIEGEIKNIVDIGAHIGSFSVKAKVHYPSALVWAYEPDKENFKYLWKNVNKLGGVLVSNTAVVGDKFPYGVAFHDEFNTGSNGLLYSNHETEGNFSKIEDIQKLVGFIDLLKIDCEGGEHNIFNRLDFSRVKYIYLELHSYSSERPLEEVIEFLKTKAEVLWMQKCNNNIYNLILRCK